MAENQIQRDNVVVAQTYVENRALPRLPEDYSEAELQKKFAKTMESLGEELKDYDEYRQELDTISREQDEEQRGYSEEELSREYIYLNRSRQPLQKEYDTAKKYADYLHEYGDEFAHLYRIKDNNEKYGNPEKIDFIEVDITDNGDLLTQDQYFKMRADVNERVKQLALHVADEENKVEYNIGMMVYDQPNMPPQVKMQLSFDEETQNNLDDEKLNAIFSFCEAHGLSIADMEIRNFDGTLAESAIREKISKALEQRQADIAAQIAEENAKEYAAQKQREKELKAELQNISLAGDGHLPEGILSEEDISYDLPEAQTAAAGVYADNELGTTAMVEPAPEHPQKVQRLDRGVATAAIPGDDVPDNLERHAMDDEVQSPVNAARSVTVPVPAQPAQPAQNNSSSGNKVTRAKVEEKFDKLMEKGLEKTKRLSYWKINTGWFGNGWTEYVVYDSEDPDHRKKDGLKGKDGTVKYTYSFKLFVKVDDEGVLHFAYRTPNHKKIDEAVLGDIIGEIKGLGYTAISFPDGKPQNIEKGMWRKAMAEKGIVPIGMSLDSSKVKGMLKAAAEKLTAEELADYKYRLAKQMNKHNREKGKKVDESEQTFIDGLINGYRYLAFTDAYSKVFKSKIKGILRMDDPEIGAVRKIAAYRAMRRVFDVYKSAMDRGGDILNAEGLTPEEKARIRGAGLSGSVQKFSNRQMEVLFDVLYNYDIEVSKKTEIRLRDELIKQGYSEVSVRGAKATPPNIIKGEFGEARDVCDSINDDLVALGVDKIELIKIPNVRLDFEKFFKVYLPAFDKAKGVTKTGSNAGNVSDPESSAKEPAAAAQNSADGHAGRPSAQPKTAAQNNPPAQPKVTAKPESTIVRNIAQNKGQVYH